MVSDVKLKVVTVEKAQPCIVLHSTLYNYVDPFKNCSLGGMSLDWVRFMVHNNSYYLFFCK
jgi:hypothetical protein